MHHRTCFLFLGLTLAVSGFAELWPQPQQRQSLRIIQTVEPVHPRELLKQGVKSGYAIFLINVSEDGRLEDWFATAYSRQEFADAALAALKRWRFEPARIAGEPVGVISEVSFGFEADQVFIETSVAETLQRMLFAIDRSQEYEICRLKDLDRTPVPLSAEAPVYGPEYAQKGITGEALVEFIIDETGRVRLPSALRADHEELAGLANEAVKTWRFEPPVRKGRPVAVRVQQLFKFEDKPAPSPSPAPAS